MALVKKIKVHIRRVSKADTSMCGRRRKDLALTLESAKRHPLNADEEGVVCKGCEKAWMKQ